MAEQSKDLTERYRKEGLPTLELKTMDEVSV